MTAARQPRARRATVVGLPSEPEAHFQAAVVKLAVTLGWRVYHPWTSIHSASGWPDLFMVRGLRAIAAELKTERGKVTGAQQAWLDALGAAGIATYVWRPSSWDEITEVLR